VAGSSRQDGLSELDCVIRFDEVRYSSLAVENSMADAEAYSYPVFRESFRKLRRESRKAELARSLRFISFDANSRNKPVRLTIDNNLRLPVLVKSTTSTTFHLVVGNSEGGMLFFACEQAPLMTLQSYDLPSRCPVCSDQNPLRGEADDNQQS